MPYNNQDFDKDWDKAPQARKTLASLLSEMRDNLTQAESLGNNASGSGELGLESDIHALSIEIDKLNKGIFRLLVLGEMKRGKSTFLNALLGERDLLPTAINPCTAILTVLRYGRQKQVTVHFNDRKQPSIIDFEIFKKRYTIPTNEATELEENNKEAFPDVAYAEVQYPLEILSKGVEIVDSPGLNDTKKRDEIALNYIADCHAILYVLHADQLFTEKERDYLRTRIQGRGLAVFFLINCWDIIEQKLFNPDDPVAVDHAKREIRERLDPIISDYLQSEKRSDYGKWVFEISSLNALRCRSKNQALDGTGFPELTNALVNFLNNDRLKSELQPAVVTSQLIQERVQKAIERRIPLLGETVKKLEEKIKSVQPRFDRLTKIRDDFETEITQAQKDSAEQISLSFKNYVNNLTETFDLDFIKYEPELKDNTQKERKNFLQKVETAFVTYLQDKISNWYKDECDSQLTAAFKKLANSANQYLQLYIQTTNEITEILLEGHDVNLVASPNSANVSANMNVSGIRTGNISDVQGIGGGVTGAVLGLMAGSNIGALVAGVMSALLPQIGASLLLTGLLAPIGILMILGSIWGVKEARKDHYISEAKRKLKEQIPKIASEKADSMYHSVSNSFSNSLKIVEQIDNDIKSQKAQLDNLLEQKKNNQISIESEKNRLTDLANTVTELDKKIATHFNQL